jgi:hypothetical protein
VVQRPRISPDGGSVVLELIEGGQRQLRVYDLQRGTFFRPTAGGLPTRRTRAAKTAA